MRPATTRITRCTSGGRLPSGASAAGACGAAVGPGGENSRAAAASRTPVYGQHGLGGTVGPLAALDLDDRPPFLQASALGRKLPLGQTLDVICKGLQRREVPCPDVPLNKGADLAQLVGPLYADLSAPTALPRIQRWSRVGQLAQDGDGQKDPVRAFGLQGRLEGDAVVVLLCGQGGPP